MARDRVGTLIGVYSCWACKMEVPVREKAEAAGGKLSAPCTWCGFKHYADRGTEHYEILKKQIRPLNGAIDPVTAAPLPKVPAAPSPEHRLIKPEDEALRTSGDITPPPPAPARRGPLFGGQR